MKNYVYIATSIDGYIATLSGGLDWLENIPNPDESDFGYNDFIKRIDAIVMGKNTFKKVYHLKVGHIIKKYSFLVILLNLYRKNYLIKLKLYLDIFQI